MGGTNNTSKVLPSLLLIHEEVGLPSCHWHGDFADTTKRARFLRNILELLSWMDVFQVIRGFSLQIFTLLIQ